MTRAKKVNIQDEKENATRRTIYLGFPTIVKIQEIQKYHIKKHGLALSLSKTLTVAVHRYWEQLFQTTLDDQPKER